MHGSRRPRRSSRPRWMRSSGPEKLEGVNPPGRMDERDLRELTAAVAAGRLGRRAFLATMASVGIAAPLAAEMLRAAGVAAQPKASPPPPARRGGGGPLRLLWWQAPTLLNPHFANGTKDVDASRVV